MLSSFAFYYKTEKKKCSKQKYIVRVWKQISEKATQVFKGAKAN